MPSSYFLRPRSAIFQGIWRLISVKESGNVLIGQGKLLVGHSRLVHSLPSGTSTDLRVFLRPGTVASAQANLHIANRKNNLSVAGAFSRAISIPSVSGPSFQVCRYHIDRLQSEKTLMAACGSRSAFADCSVSNLTCRPAQPGVAAYQSFSSYNRRSSGNCAKASMSLRNKEQPNNFLLYGYFMYNAAKRKGNANSFIGFGFEGLQISSAAYSSAGTARDVSFDSSRREGQESSSTDSSKLYVIFSLSNFMMHL